MRTLIVGLGEVGSALFVVLADYFPEVVDKMKLPDEDPKGTFDIMHICFPYSDNFESYVKEYQTKYKPRHTVVHSTVPVGTCRKLAATHSPIRGLHPHLEEGIRTFVKYLGGERASEVADYFRRAGIKVCLFDKSETTEALKLYDTLYYKRCIEFAHEVKRYCDKNGLNFHEVYTIPNSDYNSGYSELGHSEFVRPVLQPIMRPIGGHCLVPNETLLYGKQK